MTRTTKGETSRDVLDPRDGVRIQEGEAKPADDPDDPHVPLEADALVRLDRAFLPDHGDGAALGARSKGWTRADIRFRLEATPAICAGRWREYSMGIWLWIFGVMAVVILLVVVVDRRRGSTGSSRSDDLTSGSGSPLPTEGGSMYVRPPMGPGGESGGGGF